MFHTVRPRDKNDYKLNDCYKHCLQKVLGYNVNPLHCAMELLVFLGLTHGKLLNDTGFCQTLVRIEPNHFSIDQVIFCT